MAAFQLREGTLSVPRSLFGKNRSRLVQKLKTASGLPANAFVFLMGGKTDMRHDTDHENLFRQVSALNALLLRSGVVFSLGVWC
jgi:hypothetical protein